MTTTMAAGWLPIDSAPKDGTEILAWREDCGKFIASYTSADAFPLTQAELDAYDEATLFAKDWFTQWPDATRLDGSEVPTLWQPLPADPCPTCNDQGAVGNILTAQPCPDCAAPGVSTVEDQAKPNGQNAGQIVDDYIQEYELRGEDEEGRDGVYSPNETERYMIADAIYGLLANDEFMALMRRPAPAAGDALDALPPLDSDLIEILGRPNFRCGGIAARLRAGGHDIKRKSEHEQAATIHFLLGHYLKHGANWRETAGSALDTIAGERKGDA